MYIHLYSIRNHCELVPILMNKSVNLKFQSEKQMVKMYRTNRTESFRLVPNWPGSGDILPSAGESSPLRFSEWSYPMLLHITKLQYWAKYLKHANKLGEKTQKLNMTNGYFIKFNTILVPQQVAGNGNPAISNIFSNNTSLSLVMDVHVLQQTFL